MNSRERMLAALNFSNPDKIPVVYHESPAGLFTHGEKLLNLFQEFPGDNGVEFTVVPTPPAGTVDREGNYHETRIDAWGTEWEFLIFGIQGHPKKYPIQSWDEAAGLQLPNFPVIDKNEIAVRQAQSFVIGSGISLFERLHALRPMDELLIDLLTGNQALQNFMDRMDVYWNKILDINIEAGVDGIFFGDDWGTQWGPVISPELFREQYKPRYKTLMDRAKEAGIKIFFHSCGNLGPLFDDLLELGVDCLWPQICFWDENPALYDKAREHKMSLYLHPDRQKLVPLGTPLQIETTIKNYADRFHTAGGGAFFYIEIENDAPFENVDTLIRSVFKYR